MEKNREISTLRRTGQIMTLCEIRTVGDIVIVGMPLQADHVAAMGLSEELRPVIDRKPKALLFDFSHTKYVSSSGLRVILTTAKAVKAGGGRFGVFGITPFVDHIFAVSGFSRLFSIYKTEEEAVRAVSR
jgi:anti-anti-sigma factor